MKPSVITGLSLLLSVLGFPKKEFNNWYFGHYCGLSFNWGQTHECSMGLAEFRKLLLVINFNRTNKSLEPRIE